METKYPAISLISKLCLVVSFIYVNFGIISFKDISLEKKRGRQTKKIARLLLLPDALRPRVVY